MNRTAECLDAANEGLIGQVLPLPSALRMANRSEVNSCPPGMQRKTTPVSAPSLSNFTSKRPGASCCSTTRWLDVVAKSEKKDLSSAECGLALSV